MKHFDKILTALRGVGSVISPFNPAVGGGLVLASDALEVFTDFDDNSLEVHFSGLASLADELEHMTDTGEYDARKTEQMAHSLKTLSVVLSKVVKMVG